MGFTAGAKILADIIDEIANGLITSPGGYWTDNDTTWNTTLKTANNARRSLKYTNGTEEIYLSLEAVNTNATVYYGSNYFSGNKYLYGKGLRIVFSASWDPIGHIYPSTNQSTLIPFEGLVSTAAVYADLATLQVTYYLWIESNGFVIMAKPEPHPSDNNQQSFIAVVERNPNKEYSDGYSNFYCMTVGNIWQSVYDGNWATSIDRNRCILRPFAYQHPSHVSYGGWESVNGYGLSYWLSPTHFAYKSQGNGKVYYVKPIIHNHAGQLMPIMQSELFFPFSEAVGLVDGDVIAIEGATTKYLCKSLDSPDSTGRLNFAIKYVA